MWCGERGTGARSPQKLVRPACGIGHRSCSLGNTAVAIDVPSSRSSDGCVEKPTFRVDGVVALGHGSGCCMSQDSDGYLFLQRALAGYARNPNFAGVLLVGLGCEVNRLEYLLENMNLEQGPLLRTLDIQQTGGTEKTVQRGLPSRL